MKQLVLTIALLFSFNYGFSQEATATSDCYAEWYDAFQKYGASVITDGTHDVIVTVCKYSKCDCVVGKIDVSGGQMVVGSLTIQQSDGTYERPKRTLSPKYNLNPDSKIETNIFNGMSPTYLTSQDETVNVLFYKFLNKAPKTQKKAPRPGELGFN